MVTKKIIRSSLLILFLFSCVVTQSYAANFLVDSLNALKDKLTTLARVLKKKTVKKDIKIEEKKDVVSKPFIVKKVSDHGIKITTSLKLDLQKKDKILQDIKGERYTALKNTLAIQGESHPLHGILLQYEECPLSEKYFYGSEYRRQFEEVIVQDMIDSLDKDSQLVYVGLGSGTLWQDFVILNRMIQKGFSKIKVIVIDPLYKDLDEKSQQKSLDYIINFLRWFNTINVFNSLVFFSSAEAYLEDRKQDSSLKASVLVCPDVHVWTGSESNFSNIVDTMNENGRFYYLTHKLALFKSAADKVYSKEMRNKISKDLSRGDLYIAKNGHILGYLGFLVGDAKTRQAKIYVLDDKRFLDDSVELKDVRTGP